MLTKAILSDQFDMSVINGCFMSDIVYLEPCGNVIQIPSLIIHNITQILPDITHSFQTKLKECDCNKLSSNIKIGMFCKLFKVNTFCTINQCLFCTYKILDNINNDRKICRIKLSNYNKLSIINLYYINKNILYVIIDNGTSIGA